MASEEKDPRPLKYWPSVESIKAYGQKNYKRYYYLSTLPRPSIPFTEERWNIVAGVLQGDTLAPYLFIISLDYVLRTSIDKIRENDCEMTKKRSRRYPAKIITDADYADDIAILANTPNQAETQLYSLERAAAGIGLHVNAHKTEYMCYNQTGDISTQHGSLWN